MPQEFISKRKPACPFDRQDIIKPLSQIKVNYSLQDVISMLSNLNVSDTTPNISTQPPVEESKVMKKAYCFSMHELTFNRNTSKSYKLAAGSENIGCDYCRTTWTGGSWHCSICRFGLCEDCFEDQTNPETVKSDRKCENNHFLYFFKSTTDFYRRKNKTPGRIRCNSCRTVWSGGSWACRKCEYDLCQNCITVNPLFLSNNIIKCDNGHNTQLRNDVVAYYRTLGANGWQCNICKISSANSSYHCRPCRFDMCEECAEYFRTRILLDVKCPSGHNISYSNDQVKLYRRRTGNEAFVCNACMATYHSDKSYHCRRCNFDLCQRCYDTIEKTKTKGIRRKCGQMHELRWYADASKFYGCSYNCDICSRNFQDCGSVHCRACKFDVCLPCASQLLKT